MARQIIYNGIISVECELTAYRKGILSVRINFEPGMLAWKESRQWCNNFVRTLSDEQSEELLSLLKATVSPHEHAEISESLTQSEEVELIVTCPEGQQVFKSEQLDQAGWNQLRRAIEKLSRVPFRL